MRALLLSAGKGKRLMPLTLKTPKCLIKIKKKPILDLWLNEIIKTNKITSVLINTHHLSHKVHKHLNKHKYKKQIKISHENKLLGTAGTLMNNLNFFKNENGLIIHCDNYCKEGLKNFIKEFKKMPKSCQMMMMTFRTQDPKSCGIVNVNKKNIVTHYQEKKNFCRGNLANGAIYILRNKLIQSLKNKKKFFDLSSEIIPKLINKIYTYETKYFFIDIGTSKNLKKARSK